MGRSRIVKHKPTKPLQALRAIRVLIREPERTEKVFEIIEALSSSRQFERLFDRTMADAQGRRVLERDSRLIHVLNDRDRLRALPDGTLGREYARFMDAEGITADGLEEASESNPTEFYDKRAEKLGERLRDSHDLWHVVTGYGRDLLGEDALLAFTYAQTRNLGIGFISLVGVLRLRQGGHEQAWGEFTRGYRRGKKAGLMAAADWEALLELPLPVVRERLGVSEPHDYTPIFDQQGLASATPA